ncbi:MAG: hypothetical protein ABJN69_05185 [Hellea sp.]
MADIFLYISGGLAMCVAIVHGWLGATKVVGPAATPHPSSKRILHAIMFLSAIYWFVAGGVIMTAPHVLSGEVRRWAVYACAAMLLLGALGNLWGMRGKHFGGYALLVIAVLGFAGA